jgi:anti-anti-sigma factor
MAILHGGEPAAFVHRDAGIGPVVLLAGKADIESAGRLRELLVSQIWRGGRRLTVDVSELHFLDSSVVKVLVVAAKMLRERGGVVTVTAPDRYAAVAVARAVVSGALRRHALSSSQHQASVSSLVPSPRSDREQPSACWDFVV